MIRGPNVKTNFLENFVESWIFMYMNKLLVCEWTKCIMKKTIKLTESELVGIIKKVLNEYADIKNTKVGTNNKGHLTVGDKSYKITVECSKYGLPVWGGVISVSKIWKSKMGGIAALDNTDKQFTLDKQKSEDMVTKMNRGDSVIHTSATGKIDGISGSCKATLTKS